MFEPGGKSVRCQTTARITFESIRFASKATLLLNKAIFKKCGLLLAPRSFVIDIYCVRESKRRPVQQTRLRQALTSDRIKERGNPLTFSNSLGESRLGEQLGAGSDE